MRINVNIVLSYNPNIILECIQDTIHSGFRKDRKGGCEGKWKKTIPLKYRSDRAIGFLFLFLTVYKVK